MQPKFNIDMSRELSTQDNLKKSKIITLGSVIIGAILFLITAAIFENLWLLAAAILMIASGIWFVYFVNIIEKRYLSDTTKYSNGDEVE